MDFFKHPFRLLKQTFVRLIIIAFILPSCNNSADKLEALSLENENLKRELNSYKAKYDHLYYQAIVISKEDTINLGDEYIAQVELLMIDTLNPPTIVLCDWKDKKLTQTKDTIHFDQDYKTSIYKVKPDKKGTYTFAGVVSMNREEEKIERFFVVEYAVK